MALDKPGKYWRIRITAPNGRRVQRSTRTEDKKQAQQLHDKIKNDLWRISALNEKPRYYWQQAVTRWRKEGEGRPEGSRYTEQIHLEWLEKYLHGKTLDRIDDDLLEELACIKESEFIEKRRKNESEEEFRKRRKTHPSATTVNKTVGMACTILRKAKNAWKWIDSAPSFRNRQENSGVVRWLTREEANRLLAELPEHLAAMAEFSLATGLRKANVTNLKWKNIDLAQRHAYVDAPDAKARRSIPVPLNEDAIQCLRKQIGRHSEYVFVYLKPIRHTKNYEYVPVKSCNGKAWRKALKRAGIKNFRWHDLRHTWASWHVQNGTPLHILKELGSWKDYEMVLRYAHLNSDQLREAAEKISGAKLVQGGLRLVKNTG